MLTLHISCAYDHFEHMIARAFIATHITQNHLEHFYNLLAILLKLLRFLHFMHSPFDPCIPSGGVGFFLLLPCLGACGVHLSTRGQFLGHLGNLLEMCICGRFW
jgi:hypothetical protein